MKVEQVIKILSELEGIDTKYDELKEKLEDFMKEIEYKALYVSDKDIVHVDEQVEFFDEVIYRIGWGEQLKYFSNSLEGKIAFVLANYREEKEYKHLFRAQSCSPGDVYGF